MITAATLVDDATAQFDIANENNGSIATQGCEPQYLYFDWIGRQLFGTPTTCGERATACIATPEIYHDLIMFYAYSFLTPFIRDMVDRDLKLMWLRAIILVPEAAAIAATVYCLGLPPDIAEVFSQHIVWAEFQQGVVPTGPIEFV